MAVNIDILKKLIELATNNPNDNEANSAARRVCKIIKEDNFQCLSSTYSPPINPQTPRTPPWQRYRTPDTGFSDMYEEIIRQARQAADRERKRQEDLLERMRKERERKQREEREERERKQKEPKFRTTERPKWNWGYEPSDAQKDFFDAETPPMWDADSEFYRRTGTHKDQRPSKERECSKCHGIVKTFRINEEPFVCNVCQWNHWEADREPK